MFQFGREGSRGGVGGGGGGGEGCVCSVFVVKCFSLGVCVGGGGL